MKRYFIFFITLFCFFTVVKAEEINLAENAKSAILIEASTGEVIYSKNENERRSPASMTKMMSLILIMEEIENNNSTNYLRIYDNYYIVKSGIEKDVLDNNYVYYLNNSTSDNIFLAGHNSKVVFNILYRLNMSDEVIYHINNRDYVYEVINKEYIDVDDYSIFSKKNFSSLTLITCTYNNQKRYIVICRKKE